MADSAHLPLLHCPVLPQGGADTQLSLGPSTSATHLPALLHFWHSAHLASQQMLLTHALLLHWSSCVQPWPSAFLPPHRPPASQVTPPRQSPLVIHARHVPPEHLLFPQLIAAGTLQAPEPLHLASGVYELADTHSADLQVVWLLSLAQAPALLHLPVLPHELPGSIVQALSSVPPSTGLHAPKSPAVLQLWHAAVHLELQHTPSTLHTRPLAHSLSSEQSWPLPALPHRPALHLLGARHWGASPVPLHELKQLVPSVLHT